MELSKRQTYYFSISMLIFSTFYWGSTFVLVKKTVSIISIDGFLAVRFLLAAIILFVITLMSSPKELVHFTNPLVLKYGVILGTFLYLSFIFQTIGLSLTTPAKAAFITGMNVLFVPFASALPPYRRSISIRDIILALVAFIGLALMTVDFSSFTVQVGDAIIVLTAIAVAYHIIITDEAVKVPILPMLTVQIFVVGLLALAVSVINQNTWNPFSGEYPYIVWVTLLVTSVLATSFAMWSQTFAQKNHVRGPKIALIFSMEPVFALIIDIFLGIVPTLIVMAGMSIILVVTVYSMMTTEESIPEETVE